ncbi:MAG: hypothetical protein K5983_03725 [Lactobacillus sp.]|nr:hypothetical protein [Lactobacillus sp.]
MILSLDACYLYELPKIQYENMELEQRYTNMKELYDLIHNSDAMLFEKFLQSDKVINYCKTWDVQAEYVRYKLLHDDTFLLQFVKAPNKQTKHQHYAANWISKNIPFIEHVDELSAGGKNALYVDNGTVRDGIATSQTLTGKSIDFRWIYRLCNKSLTFYATHKYTKTDGGHQDNQFADVKEFLDEARKSINTNEYFFSITDGQFYQHKYTKVKNDCRTKIEFLNMACQGIRCGATCSNDLLFDMLPVLESWILKSFPAFNESVKEELKKIEIIKKRITL